MDVGCAGCRRTRLTGATRSSNYARAVTTTSVTVTATAAGNVRARPPETCVLARYVCWRVRVCWPGMCVLASYWPGMCVLVSMYVLAKINTICYVHWRGRSVLAKYACIGEV